MAPALTVVLRAFVLPFLGQPAYADRMTFRQQLRIRPEGRPSVACAQEMMRPR